MPKGPKSDAYERAKFKPGQSGNPKGTTKRQARMKQIAAMTAQQLAEIGTCLVTNNLDELREIAADKKASVLEVWIASCVMHAVKTGNYKALDVIASRIVGRPREHIEISGPERGPIEVLTPKEKEEKLRALIAKGKLLGDD